MENVKMMGSLKKTEVFEPEDVVINIMLPSSITPSLLKSKMKSSSDQIGFLYKNYPMFIDRTVLHVRKEDKKLGQEFVGKLQSTELKEEFSFSRIQKILNENNNAWINNSNEWLDSGWKFRIDKEKISGAVYKMFLHYASPAEKSSNKNVFLGTINKIDDDTTFQKIMKLAKDLAKKIKDNKNGTLE